MVKKLALGLMLLNVGFFLWATTVGNKGYTPPSISESGIPVIEMLPTNSNDKYKSKNSNLQSSCYTFGPFNSEKAARTIATMINDFGLATAINKQKTMQTLNFLVYLQPYKSLEEAKKVAKDIEKYKVNNYQIINSGPYKNAIALGSFENLDKARRRSEYIRFLGYDAKYTAQKKQKEVFWVEYDEPFSSNVPVMRWTKKIDPMASVQKIPKVCEF